MDITAIEQDELVRWYRDLFSPGLRIAVESRPDLRSVLLYFPYAFRRVMEAAELSWEDLLIAKAVREGDEARAVSLIRSDPRYLPLFGGEQDATVLEWVRQQAADWVKMIGTIEHALYAGFAVESVRRERVGRGSLGVCVPWSGQTRKQ